MVTDTDVQDIKDTVDRLAEKYTDLADEIKEGIKSVVGIAASIKLVPPKTIQRSEGKAKRTIDKRGLTETK